MYELNKRINELKEKMDLLAKSIDLVSMKKRVSELEKESTDPNLWDNQDKAKKTMQELGDLNNEISEVENVTEDIEILLQFAQDQNQTVDLENEVSRVESRFKKLEISTFLSGSYDRKDALVGIHSGQGGTEAMDWTSMLFRMYTRFAERKGWSTQVVDVTYGEEAGIKSVIFKVQGTYAYGYLKNETGAHRLVRQSPFNADKLRQTSFALVEVMPDLEEVDLPDIVIKEEDLEIQFYRSGGHGGQNVNKVSTAVRLKHIPSGVVVTAQTERFQEQNRKIAMNLLRVKLWTLTQQQARKERDEIKGEYRPASWGTQIRSYVLHPYKMVKDLRTEEETSDTDSVLDGDLDNFIEAQLRL